MHYIKWVRNLEFILLKSAKRCFSIYYAMVILNTHYTYIHITFIKRALSRIPYIMPQSLEVYNIYNLFIYKCVDVANNLLYIQSIL